MSLMKLRLSALARKALRLIRYFLRQAKISSGYTQQSVTEKIYVRLALPAVFTSESPNRNNPPIANPIQYWSQGLPPSDVSAITSEWNSVLQQAELPNIKLFSREMAADYIDKKTPWLKTPFATAFHFALEADIFRIAAAVAEGCMWLDSDQLPSRRCSSVLRFIANRDESTFFIWKPHDSQPARIANGFFN